MNDFELLKDLFTRREVGFKILAKDIYESNYYIERYGKKAKTAILLETGDSRVDGYYNLCAQFLFNENDELMEIGIWE